MSDAARILDLLRHNYMLALQNGMLKKKLAGGDPVYRYWNGAEMFSADPLKLYGSLSEGHEFFVDFRVAESQSQGACVARERVVNKIRDVFALVGETDEAAIKLANHFFEFCQGLKYSC